MSRAYQIKLSESQDKVICAEDHISTELELLNILPAEQMGALLGAELTKEGFEVQDGSATKVDGDVSVVVDLDSLKVTVRAQTSEEVTLKAEKSGRYYNDEGVNRNKKAAEKRLKGELKKELVAEEEKQTSKLQNKTTDELQEALCDVRDELDKAINRTTAEALKQKAAQLGEIKEITEDHETGSLTIVIDV
jgi:hypothetical protein